jgi:hypothetical protein
MTIYRLSIPANTMLTDYSHSSFLKGINYFEKLLGDRVKKGFVIYGGNANRTTDDYRLWSYQSLNMQKILPF